VAKEEARKAVLRLCFDHGFLNLEVRVNPSHPLAADFSEKCYFTLFNLY
jgi:hypothetical protein